MESIKELREICQNSRLWADTWHGRYICRPLSVYITRLVLFTPLSANHVTIIFFITGVIASLFFLIGGRASDLLAAIMLQLWYLLDHVDGEVARYRKTTSLAGIYMDEMVHYTVHPLVFLCIGIGQFFSHGNVTYMFLSIAAAASMIFIPLIQLVREAVFKNDSLSEKKNARAARTFSIFSSLHKSCTFPTVMNVITVVAFISLITDMNLMPCILWYYAIIGTCIWTMRAIIVILKGEKAR